MSPLCMQKIGIRGAIKQCYTMMAPCGLIVSKTHGLQTGLKGVEKGTHLCVTLAASLMKTH